MILLLGLTTACVTPTRSSSPEVCPTNGFLHGREFEPEEAIVHPIPGAVIDRIRIPGCSRTGRSSTSHDHFRPVAALPGVHPSLAVVDVKDPEIIWQQNWVQSPKLERYFVAPTCREGDVPIDMEGPWLAIPGTDANVEPDPVPPYRVEMLVATTSGPHYENAELNILVPPSLGMPITHADVRLDLWTGGTVHVIASCRGKRFVAQSVMVAPPS